MILSASWTCGSAAETVICPSWVCIGRVKQTVVRIVLSHPESSNAREHSSSFERMVMVRRDWRVENWVNMGLQFPCERTYSMVYQITTDRSAKAMAADIANAGPLLRAGRNARGSSASRNGS